MKALLCYLKNSLCANTLWGVQEEKTSFNRKKAPKEFSQEKQPSVFTDWQTKQTAVFVVVLNQ